MMIISKCSPITHRPTRRGGSVLVLVMVGLVVVLAVISGMLRSVVSESRQLRQAWPAEQAFWLCVAGRDRAALRLARDAAYTGEEWDVSSQFAGEQSGLVKIEIRRDGQQQVAHVTATLRTQAADTYRESRLWVLPESSNSEGDNP